MRRTLTALALTLVLAGTALADVLILGGTSVEPGKMFRLSVDTSKLSEKGKVVWKVRGLTKGEDGKTVKPDPLVVGNSLYFTGPPGEYQVDVRVVDFKAELFDEGEGVYTVGVPTPPTPPKPPDPPAPPGPAPSPSPIQVEGFRVMIIEETSQRPKLPAKQLEVLFDPRIRSYLKAKTAKDADYPDGAWRIWDKDTDPAGQPWVEQAMKRPRTSLPWVVIGNHPKGGYEGPLPATVEETLTLLKKYGDAP